MKAPSNSIILRFTLYAAILLSLCIFLLHAGVALWHSATLVIACCMLILYTEYGAGIFWPFPKAFTDQLTNYNLLCQLLLLVCMVSVLYFVTQSNLVHWGKMLSIAVLSISYIVVARFISHTFRLQRVTQPTPPRITAGAASQIPENYDLIRTYDQRYQATYYERLRAPALAGCEYSKLLLAHCYRDGCGTEKHPLYAIIQYVEIIRTTKDPSLRRQALRAYQALKDTYEQDLVEQARNDTVNSLDCYYRLGKFHQLHVLFPQESKDVAESYFRKAANWDRTTADRSPHADAVNELMWLDFHRLNMTTEPTSTQPTDYQIKTCVTIQSQSKWVMQHNSISRDHRHTPTRDKDDALLLYCWTTQKLLKSDNKRSDSQTLLNNSDDLHEYHQIIEREHNNRNIHDVALFSKLFIPKPPTGNQSGKTSVEDVSDIDNISSIPMDSPSTESMDESQLKQLHTRFSDLMDASKPQSPDSPSTITTRLGQGITPYRNNLVPILEGETSAVEATDSDNMGSQSDENEVSRSLSFDTPSKEKPSLSSRI